MVCFLGAKRTLCQPATSSLQQEKRIDTFLINRLNDTAYAYNYRSPDTTIYLANLALKYTRQERFIKGEANALINLGRAYYTKGEYDKSLRFTLEGNKLSKQIGYKDGIAIALNNIGLIFIGQNKIKEALAELNRAVLINNQIKNDKNLTANYFNIALCHVELNNYKDALIALDQTVRLSKKVNNELLLVMATNKLGDIAFRRKEYQKAITFYMQVINHKKIPHEWEDAFAYTGIALSYFELQQYQKAIINGEKGLVYAKNVNAHWDIERALAVLNKAYAAVGNYKRAYEYLQSNKKYNDSLYNEQKEKEINALHLKQKQIENEDLEHQIELKKQKEKLSQLIMAIASLFVIFLSIILIIKYRKNREVRLLNQELVESNLDIANQKDKISLQHQALADLNHSKDQLFSVIGHDIRSPILSIIQTIDLLRSNHLSAEETKMILDRFFEKLTATATMLDNLLLWANQQKNKVKVEPSSFFLPQLTDQLLLVLNFMANEKQVDIVHFSHTEAQAFADINHSRIILQNLISNAIKFTPSNGNIHIHYFRTEEKVGMVIKDSGVGIAKDKLEKLFHVVGKEISTYGTANEKGIGIGLMLVKKYAEENNIEIIINSDDEGTEFVLVFPTQL